MADSLTNAPIESWEVASLKPYEKNNKKHPPEQVAELAKSIAESGIENPILIEEDGTIISGHGRWMAVQSLGWTKVTVRVARGLSKDKARKLRIAVNKTTGVEYDTDALTFELGELQNLGFDLEGMGLSDRELSVLIEDIGEVDFGVVTEDITEEVAKHEEGIKKTADEAEASTQPIAKVFGVKHVSNADARVIGRFMGLVEDQVTGEGFPALVAYMKRELDAAA